MSLPPIDASFSWAAREQKPIDPELEAELAALHEDLGVERGAGLAGVGTKPELIVPTPPLEMAVASNPLVGSANNEHHEAGSPTPSAAPQQALSRCESVVAEAKQSIDAARTAGSPTKEKIAAAQKLVAEARQAHTAMRSEVKQTLQEMQAQLAHDMQACVQTAGATTPLSTSAALEASKR